MLEKKNIFLLEEGIQNEGFSNLWKRRVYYRDHVLSSSLRSKGFDVNEEINYTKDGTLEDEFDGYMCNISKDANSDGTLRRASYDSMNESTNEERNNETEKEQDDNENERRNSCIPSKGRFVWQGVECELVDDVGLFVASGCVIACDPKEVVIDN
jgi:hypothetical protein